MPISSGCVSPGGMPAADWQDLGKPLQGAEDGGMKWLHGNDSLAVQQPVKFSYFRVSCAQKQR